MARARNIKPSFFKNEDLAELPFSTRLLFIGLWMLADREGRLEDRPKRIKMEVFPGDDCNVEKGLSDLHASGFIHRYEVDGGRYIEVCAFLKHQNPHHREPPSIIPKPEANPQLQLGLSPGLETHAKAVKPEASPRPAPERHGLAGLNPSSLNPESPSLIPESREKAMSGKPNAIPPRKPNGKGAEPSEAFIRFWGAWPKSERKGAKGECFERWRKFGLDEQADVIISHVETMKRSRTWTEDGGKYIEAPLVYLNGRKWDGAETVSAQSTPWDGAVNMP